MLPVTAAKKAEKTEKTEKTEKKRFAKRVRNMFTGLFSRKKKDKKEKTQDENEEQITKKDIELSTVISTMQTAASTGSEIYSLLINNSIDTALKNAEKFLATLKWGDQEEFVAILNEKSSHHQRGKASLLMQIKIAEAYLDSRTPLLNFIQDITIEKNELKRYEEALVKLSTHEWVHKNETIKNRIDFMLTNLNEVKKNLELLHRFTMDLMSHHFEPLSSQSLFRSIDTESKTTQTE
jgi:hypothetical protein